MKRKVDKMEKTVSGVIGLHGSQDELPPPHEKEKEDKNPAPKVERVYSGFNMEDNVSEKVSSLSGISPSAVRPFAPLPVGPGLDLIPFKNGPAL
jgi:hypothetical protein